MAEQIGGFFPVPLLLFKDTYHYVFVKKHTSRDKSEDGRAVFVTNLPADADREKIKALCQSLGDTIMEEFTKEGNRGQITLVDKSSCNRFLNKAKAQTTDSKNQIKWPESQLAGSSMYLAMNRAHYLDQKSLQNDVDVYMEKFALTEEEFKRQQLEQRNNPVDDDGWTTVGVSKKRTAVATAAPKLLNATDVGEKKKKNKEKDDFYRFQLREQKKNEMNSLLKRYQDDKEKVRHMREKRRFRPY